MTSPTNNHPTRLAFTLVELLVVIAIIGILVLLLLPAISAARESARRTSCINHLSQLGIALSDYHMGQEVYPAGTTNDTGPIRSDRKGMHHSWTISALPYIEERNAFQKIDSRKSVYDPINAAVVSQANSATFRCPTASWGSFSSEGKNIHGEYVTDYAACHHDQEAPIDADNHGIMFLNSKISQDDVTDGLTKTILLGEKLSSSDADFGWISGTRGTLRNTGAFISTPTPENVIFALSGLSVAQPTVDPYSSFDESADEASEIDRETPTSEADELAILPDPQPELDDEVLLYVGGFGSEHPGISLFLFADGHVQALKENISPKTYQLLGHRNDGALMGAVEGL